MKLSSDRAVTRVTYEGITSFDSLTDFDKKSIESLSRICKETIPAIPADAASGIAAEPSVPGANVSSISIRRLITSMHAAKYYTSINRTMTTQDMHYANVLSNFKIEWESYEELSKQDEPEVPSIVDKDSDRKIIKWVPIFKDCLSRTYGSKGPLSYILRDDPVVPDETDDPLGINAYYGKSGSLQAELEARLPHSGPIFNHDNATVYLKIEKAARGTSVESTIKTFARTKDGRGAFLALIANHAGDTKYRAIMKKKMNVLQNVRWNGRAYPLESLVSNHRQAVDDLRECSAHITVPVPDESQRVEYLIDSIICTDSTLQAAIGLIRANTNDMRTNFEAAASSLIEVDPYRRSQKTPTTPRQANISAIDFSAGRGASGVDLRWHHPKEFKKLEADQKEELTTWMKTQEGKKLMRKSRKEATAKKRKNPDYNGDGDGKNSKKNNAGGNWKKKFKKALKTNDGLKTVMSVLAEEEQNNSALIAALHAAQAPSAQPPTAPAPTPAPTGNQAPPNATVGSLQGSFPATSVKLQSILKNSS